MHSLAMIAHLDCVSLLYGCTVARFYRSTAVLPIPRRPLPLRYLPTNSAGRNLNEPPP